MHYTVTMKYKDITAETTVEAGSEKEAIRQASGRLWLPGKLKYPDITAMPKEAEITVNAIPEPDPQEEIESLEAEKASIEARLVEARGKVATMEKSRA